MFAAGTAAQQQASEREPTDIHIRRMAGLPAESAKGQIRILDVGHHPMDTMISIVGNRSAAGWRVSYACAMSPRCGKDIDHEARQYTLSAQDSAEVEGLLAELRTGKEPDGMQPSPDIIGGWLRVTIDDGGFKHEYSRVLKWGKTLGRLEELLSKQQS